MPAMLNLDEFVDVVERMESLRAPVLDDWTSRVSLLVPGDAGADDELFGERALCEVLASRLADGNSVNAGTIGAAELREDRHSSCLS